MNLTLAEKIQLAMLCDLAKRPRQRMLDYEFIQRAVLNNDLWALDRRFVTWDLEVAIPPEVEIVQDKLRMWDSIEEAYERLDPAQQERVKNESYMRGGPKFPGFFGRPRMARHDPDVWHVNELRIAKILVHDLKNFPRFRDEGRLIAGNPFSPRTYDRMLDVWRPIHEKTKHERHSSSKWDLTFSADEVIQIVRERVDPSKRQVGADGWWAPYEEMDTTGFFD